MGSILLLIPGYWESWKLAGLVVPAPARGWAEVQHTRLTGDRGIGESSDRPHPHPNPLPIPSHGTLMTRSCHWGVGHGQDTHISGWGEEQKLQDTVTGARIPGSFPPAPRHPGSGKAEERYRSAPGRIRQRWRPAASPGPEALALTWLSTMDGHHHLRAGQDHRSPQPPPLLKAQLGI